MYADGDDSNSLPKFIQQCVEPGPDGVALGNLYTFVYFWSSGPDVEPTLYHVRFVVELQEDPLNYVVRLTQDCDVADDQLSAWATASNFPQTFSIYERLSIASQRVGEMFYSHELPPFEAQHFLADDSCAVAFPIEDPELLLSSSSTRKRSRDGNELSSSKGSTGSIGMSRLAIEEVLPVPADASSVVHAHAAATASSAARKRASRANKDAPLAADSNAPGNGPVRLSRWSFTLFDTTRRGSEVVHRDDIERLKKCLDPSNGLLRYFVYQIEKCPNTGRPHVQGYLELQKSTRHAAVKKLFSDPDHQVSVHVDGSRKGYAANKEYCTKEKNKDGTVARWPDTVVVEHGNPSMYGESEKSGKQSHLQDVIADLHAGKSLYELEHKPSADLTAEDIIKRRACIARFRKHLIATETSIVESKVPSTRDVFVEVIWGPPGTGKSRIVDERWRPRKPEDKPFHEVVFRKVQTTGAWFDGYKGQPVLVLDDFDGWLDPHTLIQILDKYHMSVQVKGACVSAMWTHVVILSNKEPLDWWNYRENVAFGVSKVQQVCKPHQMESILSRIGSNIRSVRGEDLRSKYGCDKIGVPANDGFVDPDI